MEQALAIWIATIILFNMVFNLDIISSIIASITTLGFAVMIWETINDIISYFKKKRKKTRNDEK